MDTQTHAADESTVEVALCFWRDARRRSLLLADEFEIAEITGLLKSQMEEFENQKENMPPLPYNPDIPEEVQALTRDYQIRTIEQMIERAQAKLDTYLAEHQIRMSQAVAEYFTIAPYSYWDRLQAEDAHTEFNRETGESRRKDELVRDQLLVKSIKSHRFTDPKTEEQVSLPLNPAKVRRLTSPVAARLWRLLKEWSEPNEGELFRP